MVFAPYVLLIAAHLVHPVDAPQLNVKPTCRAASNLDLPYGQSFRTCMQDEREARREVTKNWTSYQAPARSRCSAEVMIGGDPSYVELLVCLEDNKALSGKAGDLESADLLGSSAKAPRHDAQPH
jgi:hypothetical protein